MKLPSDHAKLPSLQTQTGSPPAHPPTYPAAADLPIEAEHGTDSTVVLITPTPSLADAADAVITACESQLGVSLCENKISLVPSCPASRPRAAAGARAAASGGPGRRRVSRHRERQRKYKYDCN